MRELAVGIPTFLFGVAILGASLYEPKQVAFPSLPRLSSTHVSKVIESSTDASPSINDAKLPPLEESKTSSATPLPEIKDLPKSPSSIAAIPLQDSMKSTMETDLRVVSSGPTTLKQVALTFDDGPHRTITPKILDILREHQVKATFFVLGERVKLYPWILRQIVAEGHEIGNHSYSHRFLTAMSNETIGREIFETQNAIKNAIGYETPLFRPPYGAFRHDTRAIFHEYGLSIVLWSVDTKDWRVRNPDKILHSVISQARNGSIILCHDIHEVTLEALPQILTTLKAEGYTFMTVSQLCGLPTLRLATISTTNSLQQTLPIKP